MKFLGKGQNARCYLIDGRVYKKYKNKYIALSMESNIINLLKYTNDTFIFPDELKYINDVFKGYYMEYKKGNKVFKLDGSILIDNYIIGIIKAEYDMADVTMNKILICDAGLTNTIYSEDNRIYIFDTDYYIPNCKVDNIYSKNLYKLSYSVLYPYFDIYEIHFILPKLNYYLKLVKEGKMLPSNFLYEVKRNIEKVINEEINSLDEFKKSLKLI